MKPIKACSLLVAVVLLSNFVSHAAGTPIAPTNSVAIHGYWDSSIRDHYLSYRTERAPNKTPVWWNELDVDLPYHGVYLDVWSSDVLTGTPSQRAANELDLVIGKRGKIGGLSYDGQFRYLNLNPIGSWRDREDYVDFGLLTTYDSFPAWKGNTIQPALDVEWLARCRDFGDGGLIFQPGFIHKWKAPFGLRCLTLVDKEWFS